MCDARLDLDEAVRAFDEGGDVQTGGTARSAGGEAPRGYPECEKCGHPMGVHLNDGECVYPRCEECREAPRASVNVEGIRRRMENSPYMETVGFQIGRRELEKLLALWERAEQGNWEAIAEAATTAREYSENEGDCDYINAIFDAIPDVPSESS